jgi:DNA-binding MarR family transcriptional regulator
MGRQAELSQLLGNLSLRARAEGVDPAVEIDLTKCELCILARLVFDGPLHVRGLVADLAISPSMMTTVVDRLVDRKLVRREVNPEDRRRVVLHGTDAAAFTLRQSTVGFAAVAAQMLEGLTESEQEDLLRLLRRAIPGF